MLQLSFLHGNFPPAKQCHYSTPSLLSQYQPFSLPTTHLSTKVMPKSTTKPTFHTTNAKHHLEHKLKHQLERDFALVVWKVGVVVDLGMAFVDN